MLLHCELVGWKVEVLYEKKKNNVLGIIDLGMTTPFNIYVNRDLQNTGAILCGQNTTVYVNGVPFNKPTILQSQGNRIQCILI